MREQAREQEPGLRVRDCRGLIESYLGAGQAGAGCMVWKPECGRPCLVYLHTWANGSQSVTTLDAARPVHDMVSSIDLDEPGGVADLERELKSFVRVRE